MWSQNSGLYDPKCPFGQTHKEVFSLHPIERAFDCCQPQPLSFSNHCDTFDSHFFPSKTAKICSLPPIFEILPVKSLKARNQTLAPPFPELRYLSLAYNKVTAFDVSLGHGWEKGCEPFWPEVQQFLPCIVWLWFSRQGRLFDTCHVLAFVLDTGYTFEDLQTRAGAWLIEYTQHVLNPGFQCPVWHKVGVAHPCDPATWELVAGGSRSAAWCV